MDPKVPTYKTLHVEHYRNAPMPYPFGVQGGADAARGEPAEAHEVRAPAPAPVPALRGLGAPRVVRGTALLKAS